jgi:hypothetical protein
MKPTVGKVIVDAERSGTYEFSIEWGHTEEYNIEGSQKWGHIEEDNIEDSQREGIGKSTV